MPSAWFAFDFSSPDDVETHPAQKASPSWWTILSFPDKKKKINSEISAWVQEILADTTPLQIPLESSESLMLPSFPLVELTDDDTFQIVSLSLKKWEKALIEKDYLQAEKYLLEAFSFCNSKKIPEGIYTALGFVYAKLGKYSEALEMLSDAIDINPNNPFSYNNIGYVLDKKEQKEYVEACYKRAIKIAPQVTLFYLSLAYHYMKERKFFEAEQYCKKAISLDSWEVKSYFLLARVYDSSGKQEEAREVYRKVAKLHPRNAYLLHIIAKRIWLLWNQRESLKYLHQAVDIDPKNVHYLLELGYAYYTVRNYKEALITARKALEFTPDNAHIKKLTTLLEAKIKESMKFH